MTQDKFTVVCPHCQKAFYAPLALAGKPGKCGACKVPFIIPMAAPEPVSAVPSAVPVPIASLAPAPSAGGLPPKGLLVGGGILIFIVGLGFGYVLGASGQAADPRLAVAAPASTPPAPAEEKATEDPQKRSPEPALEKPVAAPLSTPEPKAAPGEDEESRPEETTKSEPKEEPEADPESDEALTSESVEGALKSEERGDRENAIAALSDTQQLGKFFPISSRLRLLKAAYQEEPLPPVRALIEKGVVSLAEQEPTIGYQAIAFLVEELHRSEDPVRLASIGDLLIGVFKDATGAIEELLLKNAVLSYHAEKAGRRSGFIPGRNNFKTSYKARKHFQAILDAGRGRSLRYYVEALELADKDPAAFQEILNDLTRRPIYDEDGIKNLPFFLARASRGNSWNQAAAIVSHFGEPARPAVEKLLRSKKFGQLMLGLTCLETTCLGMQGSFREARKLRRSSMARVKRLAVAVVQRGEQLEEKISRGLKLLRSKDRAKRYEGVRLLYMQAYGQPGLKSRLLMIKKDLIRATFDEDLEIRSTILRTLGPLLPEIGPDYVKAFKKQRDLDISSVLQLISSDSAKAGAILPGLEAVLDKHDHDLKRVFRSIARVPGEAKVLAAIYERGLKSKDGQLQMTACERLEDLPCKATAQVLTRFLKRSKLTVPPKVAAIVGLRACGREAKGALPILKKLASKGENPSVRSVARSAIAAIKES